MIIIFFLFLITYSIGYIAGYLSRKVEYSSGFSELLYKGKNIVSSFNESKSIPTGIIKTPTAKEVAIRKLPEKKREGLEAMKDTLADIPELQTRRRLIEELGKTVPMTDI